MRGQTYKQLIGERVKIEEGSGLDSNKTGLVIPYSDVPKKDKDEFMRYPGFRSRKHFNSISWLLLDNGECTWMFTNRLEII
jgi:hypothetical protein